MKRLKKKKKSKGQTFWGAETVKSYGCLHCSPHPDQRNLGMSMRVERSTLDQVKKRFEVNKKKMEEKQKDYDFEERMKELREEVRLSWPCAPPLAFYLVNWGWPSSSAYSLISSFVLGFLCPRVSLFEIHEKWLKTYAFLFGSLDQIAWELTFHLVCFLDRFVLVSF